VKRENAVDQKLYDKGMELRRAVMGTAYVDRALAANQDDIGKPIQDFITEHGWGAVWGREGLSRKTRSMLNLAMLTALGKPAELKLHVKGALANGVSVEEIKEILLHAAVYCGIPAGLDAFKAAHEVLIAEGAIAAKS
jgi:4-carboxymuconolactone decarboxylase